MRNELGKMIRKYREKRELERAELAKKLQIAASYVMHLENESIGAAFSNGLMTKVVNVLHLPKRKAMALADAHNRRVRSYRQSLKRRKSA